MMMKIRSRYIMFIAVIHTAALLMSYFIFKENKIVFLISEALILVSLAFSWSLYKSLIQPIEMISGGAEAIRDRDFSVKMIQTGAEEIDRLVEVYNQMIEQLRKERVLQQEKHFFLEKLLQTAPVGTLILDFDGKLESMNPKAAEVLALKMGDGQQKPVLPMDHPFWQPIQLLKPGSSTIFQTNNAKKFKISKATFMDRGFARAFVIIEELTVEILEAEKKAYGKVIRMMAHEINNSIGAVNSILDTVRQNEQDQLMAKALQVAVERNERLSLFMRRFADVIRLPEPRREPFDLNELIRKTANLMEYYAAQNGVKFQLDLDPAPLLIHADMQQMEQVLINIIKNAIESIEKEGVVRFCSQCAPRRLQIVDNGRGIASDVAPLLFSPFYTNKNGGQGVGLTLIREILSQHQFEFSLQTKANGETVFEIEMEHNKHHQTIKFQSSANASGQNPHSG